MRKVIFSFFWCPVLLLFLGHLPELSAQEYITWKWSHQKPQGNPLNWIKVWNANTWYMVGNNGTFMKTTNAGANWYFHHQAGVPLTTGIGATTTLLSAWFFDMNTGVACGNTTNTQQFVRTTNGGVTWDTAQGSISGPFWADMWFVNNTHGFAAGSTSGRFARTTDGGMNWIITGTTNASLPTGTYNSIYAFDTNKVIIAATLANIRTTTNGGANWTLTQASTGTSAINKMRFMDANTGFVVGASGNVWLTTNGGTNWTSKPTGNTSAYQDVVFKPNTNEVYVVGDAFNIYKSTNLGDNWTAVPFLAPVVDQPWTSTFFGLGFAGDTMVTVGNSGLINRSTNNGANWTTFTYYVKAGTLNSVWAESNNGNVWAVGAPGSTGNSFDQVMFSSNGGTNWTFQPIPGSTATFNSISMLNSMTGYIAGTTGRVRKTTNGGTTWDSVATGTTVTLNKIKFVNANTGWIFGSTTGLVSKTTDGGATWTPQTSGVTVALNAADFINDSTGMFAGASGRLRRTTNGGATWDSVFSTYGSTINDMVMVNSSTGYFVGLTGNMRVTTDGGVSWDTITTPVSTTLSAVDFVDPMNGMIVGTTGYSAKTSDGGQTWTFDNAGGGTLNEVDMTSIDTAYSVGTTGAVHKFADFVTNSSTFTNNVPEKYFIAQNYPNPFNPTTTIRFGLPREGTVSLKIYDIAGREVARIFNNLRFNAGEVSHNFNGSMLSSGVYFYSLIVDGEMVATKKMVLMK